MPRDGLPPLVSLALALIFAIMLKACISSDKYLYKKKIQKKEPKKDNDFFDEEYLQKRESHIQNMIKSKEDSPEMKSILKDLRFVLEIFYDISHAFKIDKAIASRVNRFVSDRYQGTVEYYKGRRDEIKKNEQRLKENLEVDPNDEKFEDHFIKNHAVLWKKVKKNSYWLKNRIQKFQGSIRLVAYYANIKDLNAYLKSVETEIL